MVRINNDPRHRELVVLLKTELPETLFPGWGMATSMIPEGDIAREIELTYRDRLADLNAVDRLMSIMQRFRPLDGVANPAVVIDSASSIKLALTKLATQDNAIQSLLELGKSIFSGCDVALAIREPGDNGYSILTNSGADVSAITLLLKHFPNDQFSAGTKSCRVNQDGTVHWSTTVATGNLSSAVTAFPPPRYAATGVPVIDPDRTNPEQPDPQQTHPLRTGTPQEVTGVLWVLSNNAELPDNATETHKLTLLARSIAEQIEHRRAVYFAGLQQQNSQRQQLTIAAKLRRLEAVVNVAGSAILALDRNGRVLMINDAARRIFGFDAEKVPFSWPDPTGFLDPETLIPLSVKRSPLQYALARVSPDSASSQQHGITNKLIALKRSSTSPLYFLRFTSTEVDETDSAIWSVLVFEDVTALETSRERIRRSDRLEALGQLTGGIAHDFNNLLATIQSSIELAGTERDQSAQNQLHDIALSSVQRGAALTNRLITFAIASPAEVKTHRLTSVMQSLLELSQSSIAEDIELVVAPFPSSIGVKCDAGQLENALLNILINSRDAIRDGGTGGRILIEVNVAKRNTGREAMVEISLSDDGPGMSEEVLRRATDPFFSTRHDNSGSGLGLSMVYGFVQQSGGELLIENLRDTKSPLTGTRITLTLEHATAEPPAIENSNGDTVVKHHRAANILLVEDEQELARVLELTLQRHGHNVRRALNGKDAMQIVNSSFAPDLLLTDIVLPGRIDGCSLAIEAVNVRPELRVVYLSGYTRHYSEASLLGPVLSKPVSTQELMQVVQKGLAFSVDPPTVES